MSRMPDLERYRTLLKNADDETKRLALIDLLMAERARDKLATRSKPVETEPPSTQVLPIRSHSAPFEAKVPPPESQNTLAGERDQQVSPEPEAARAAADPQVPADPSRPDHLVDAIAKLLSGGRPNRASAHTIAQTYSPQDTDDVDSMASQIQAALAKRDPPES